MKSSKKVDEFDYKNCKSASVSSMSDSCSSSDKGNWKRIAKNGNLFYAKYIQENGTDGFSLNDSGRFDNPTESKSHLKLSTIKNEAVKEIGLTISSSDRYRFGRRSSIVESMLGFGVIPFVDNVECLMVAKIIDNSIKVEYPYIKEGDWFKSLEDIEVRVGNVEKLLLQYTAPTKVKLIFKGTCDKAQDVRNVFEANNLNDFVDTYKRSFKKESKLEERSCSVFLTLILNREYYTANSTECLFYYPFTPSNFLHKAKGSFLTLDSVVNNDLKSRTVQSTLVVDCTKYYITYGHVNGALIVCAFSSLYQNKKAAKSNGNDFINFLRFTVSEFRSLQTRPYLTHVCDILKINIENNIDKCLFNSYLGSYLSSSVCIALPKEAQLRISDALSELESMDYKRWDETQETLRHLVVSGTALYYNRYLLSSNLSVNLRTDIECFLRLRGISEFVLKQNVKELYVWEQIERLDTQHKHFLAICVRDNLLLVVVLQSTLAVLSGMSCIPYLEEIAETVDYLISCGIKSISKFWVESSNRPSVNLNKVTAQMHHKFKFTHLKESYSESVESNNSRCESPPHSLSHREEICRKKSEPESSCDWQAFSNKNGFRELDHNCHYVEPLLNEVKNMTPLNLTTGWSNDLKFFLYLNFADATIMQPFETIPDFQLGVIKEYILAIHEIIQINSNLKKQEDVGLNLNKNVVLKEHSISVDVINGLGIKETIVIVGRLFSFPLKEVYVCFGQNVSQNLVEQYFRTSFLNIG